MKTNDIQTSKNQYQFSHGKEPRGTGSWAFCPADKYRRNDYLDFVFWAPRSTFKVAMAAARAHFAALNVSEIVVCP